MLGILEPCLARVRPQPVAPLRTALRLTAESYGRIPRYYVKCTLDRGITPAFQDKMISATPVRRVFELRAGKGRHDFGGRQAETYWNGVEVPGIRQYPGHLGWQPGSPVTPDGRYVLFLGFVDNFPNGAPGDRANHGALFLRDRATGTTTVAITRRDDLPRVLEGVAAAKALEGLTIPQ